MARHRISFDELVEASLRDVLESDALQEIIAARPIVSVKSAYGTRVREDLVAKLAPFSKVQGVAFATNALRDYRMDWSGLTRQKLTREVELIVGRGAFKKRIGKKIVHIVPFTADRATPAHLFTYLHYIRAAMNGGEGAFVISQDRDVYNDGTTIKAPATQKAQPAPNVYEPAPTIQYNAPSVLSYGDDEPRGGDDHGWKWS